MSRRTAHVISPNPLVLVFGLLLMLGVLGWYVHKQYQAEQLQHLERSEQN